MKIVYSYKQKTNIPLEDLFDVAVLGIMDAIEQYDPYEHSTIQGYICIRIMQAINRYIANHELLIRVPIHIWEILEPVRKLSQNYDEAEFVKQVSLMHNITADKARKLISLLEIYNIESFDQLLEDNRLDRVCMEDLNIIDVEYMLNIHTQSELSIKLNEALQTLTEREERVLRYRYGLETGKELTLEDVGYIFGVTRERIRQIEMKALRKLSHPSRSQIIKGFLD